MNPVWNISVKMEAYLDNSATTRVDPEAAELMNKIYLEDWGNPSSLHIKGFEAQKYLRDAYKTFSKLLRCPEKEIYFTSGGTESNNTAIIGAAFGNRRRAKHIITTKIEHEAVLQPFKFLEEREYETDYLSVDEKGHIDPDELSRLLRPDTLLVSIMHVNNEVGSLEPVHEAGKLIKEISPGCLFHVDDVQGFGKLRLIPKENNIDLLSVSAHKLHGPKGCGLLYMKEGSKVSPIVYGGGQQRGFRSGTENVAGIAGFALAAEKLCKNMDDNFAKYTGLRDCFHENLKGLDDIKINGGDVPYIISLTVFGVRAEVLLHALEERGIYVSSGSACASNRPAVSETLKAMGAGKEALDSTIRLSLCADNTEEEMKYAAENIKELTVKLRQFVRR